jgi:hypothetical protein
MNTNPNFTSILDRPMSTAERPKPLPVGTYLCVVDGQPKFDQSKQKKTDFVEFTLKVLQPQDDVDAEAVAELKDGVQGKTLRATYYLTEDALWRLKEFLGHLGIEEGTGFRDAISQAPGNQVLASVRHRASQDGQAVFAEIAATAAV